MQLTVGARRCAILERAAPSAMVDAVCTQGMTVSNATMTDATMTLAAAIDTIEDTYAYMLAYAGQGRGRGEDGEDSIRDYLRRAESALDVVAAMAMDGSDEHHKAFVDLVRQDAARARTALRFVLGQKAIGSQIVDNLNASIHLRTLLTDLFLLDEALKISGILNPVTAERQNGSVECRRDRHRRIRLAGGITSVVVGLSYVANL